MIAQKGKTFLFILITFLLFSFNPAKKPLHILALGDSITQGGNGNRPEYTYRLPLQMILHREKISYDFIGSQKEGLHEDFEWPDVARDVPFDPEHDGYYGNKTANAVQKAIAGYSNYQIAPDIVLIHLGTNDQKQGDFKTNVGKPLREAILFFRDKNPEVKVMLGHLNFNGGKPVLEIREVVEHVAKDLTTKESPVISVHHYKGWVENPDEVYTDTFDWAHPNLKGQEKMAVNWWMAIKPYIGK